ncbi:retrovirus-related pol polyprotein from transposon TNT 1-94 [Tanacetum coccineum]
MANLSEDIQCAGSDTRLPMLDRTDFASWQQRIRLYFQGKENENRGQGKNAQGAGAAGYGGAQNRVGNANPGQARQIKCYNCNGIDHIARNCTQPKRPQNSEYFKDKMLLMQAQENRVALDEEQLLFIAGGQDNAVDEDVYEQPVQDLALNVDNVFQVMTLVIYDSDILSKVYDHDHYQDAVCEHHEVHEMHDDSTLPTKGTRSIISTVSISLEGFLPSILLSVVMVVIVAIILVVVVVAIVGVVIVVAIIGVVVVVMIFGIVGVVSGVPSTIKLSFMIIGFLHRIAL